MSTTPIIPLSSVFAPSYGNSIPDSTWEYLELTILPHTIDLVNQYRKICLMAVNNNIIKFHQDITLLNYCLENLLALIKRVEDGIRIVHAKHAGRTGSAIDPASIADFLSIHEEYVILQSALFEANNAYFVPLERLVTEASQRAQQAQQQNEGNK